MPLSILTRSDFRPQPAEQAARAFAKKAALTSDIFERLSDAARQHAFRLAGLHKASLVQHARNVVHRAIREGTSFAEVRRDLLARFETEGVPQTAVRRLRIMFIQNVQQAYNDGRREVLDDPKIAGAFPFRQYLTVGNGTPGVRGVRPEHAALHGKVLRWDDPFWDSHTPPWGFGCRCFFRPLTTAQVKRMGVRVVTGGYVGRRIRVPGRGGRGIKPDPRFKRGAFDLKGIDRELRQALERMMK